MTKGVAAEAHIVVVDSRPQDYADLATLAADRRCHLHFLTTGTAAIEFTQRKHPALWMINTRLPDIAGLDLVALLREQSVSGCVCLIGDQYHPREEQIACCRGADLYLSKDATRTIQCRPILESMSRQIQFDMRQKPTILPGATGRHSAFAQRRKRRPATMRSPDS